MRLKPLSRVDLRFGSPGFYLAALAGLFVAYAAILSVTSSSRILPSAAANVLSLALPAFGIRLLLRRFLFGRPAAVQVAAHPILALAFTIAWFWLLMVMLGILSGANAVRFSVEPFLGPAAVWQLFQGVTLYALVAVTCYAEWRLEALPAPEPAPDKLVEAEEPPFRLFVRQDDEIRPLDTDRIILVRGADDYSEIVTASGTHLVRLTLAELGERLGSQFLRVHRSFLVNGNRVEKAEPAGSGRILLHMENGERIATSRAGARLLRERII